MLVCMTPADALRILSRNVESVVPKGGLEEKLSHASKKRRPLVVKLGLDPTAPDIHLGHVVVLQKLREFQDMGHRVVLIVGDFTARIGDPSGRSRTRPALSVATIKKNAATYKKQVVKILNPKRLSIQFNSAWLGELEADDMLKLLAKTTTAQILARDDFHAREMKGESIGLHELVYPLLQAQDSVAIKADIEIGGTDQLFNMLMGRELQASIGQEPQVVLTMPLLVGSDGKQKMSKSLGNYIGITEPARTMFGKTMSLPDHLILPYFRLLTNLTPDDIAKEDIALKSGRNPMEAKFRLSFEIVKRFSGEHAATNAREIFQATFSRREFPKDAKRLMLRLPTTLLAFVAETHKLFPSKSEARRKIDEGAVELDGVKVTDWNTKLSPEKGKEYKLKIGKKGFFLLVSR